MPRADAAVFVADQQGIVVGSLIGTFDGWRGHMYRLAVHPQSRRRGIARSLVAATEETLQHMGATRILALVELDRPWAVQFWESVGYEHGPAVQRWARQITPKTTG